MPYLAFPGALSLLLLAAVLVLRRKWRSAAARNEEVTRLVVLAAEEVDSAVVYTFGAPPPARSAGGSGEAKVRMCAVCFSPTTTRCSKCKSVRYCSGKCQIIHWRQGHKDQCRPPPITQHQLTPQPVHKTTHTVESKLADDIPNGLNSSHADIHLKDHISSDPTRDSDTVHTKDDLEAKVQADEAVSKGASSSSTTTPSNSSTFASPEKPDSGSVFVKRIYGDAAVHVYSHNASSSNKTRKEGPVTVSAGSFSSEVATRETSVNKISHLDKLNQKIAISSTENTGYEQKMEKKSVVTSVGSVNAKSAAQQDITLKSDLKIKDTHVDLSKYNTSKEEFESQSEPMSSFQFSFSMSGDPLPKNINVSNAYDAAFPETSHSSANKRKTYECPPVSRELKFPSNVAPAVSTRGEEKHVLHKIVPDSDLAQPIGLSGNTSFPSSGGHALKSSVRRVVQQLKPSKPSKFSKMLPLYDLYIKLYNEKVELQPCGLVNCGNSCYANAVLQCLSFTRPLTTYFLHRLHSQTCQKVEWCFTCELESLVIKMKQGKSPLSPIGILSRIHNIGSNLGHGKEEDAHEFLRYAIDAMQSTFIKEVRKDSLGSISEEITLVDLIFGGHLRSKIKCLKCQGTSERYERMMDLTVEIHGDISTLDEALARFTTTEILDGENKYRCSRCKTYEKAKKKLTILEAPNVLTIALKRFQSGKFGKLNKAVQFPENLNMNKYMSSSSHDKAPDYYLYAVVVHLDIMNAAFSGHYVCYVKNAQGKWYKTDDRMVKPVELDRVLSKGAYMLFYARCTPRAPNLKTSRRKGVPRPGSNPYRTADTPGPFDPAYRTQMVDSSSDSSFPFSDEASTCTESTRDSSSTDDFSDYIFGDSSSLSWSPSRVSEDPNGYISYSPSRYSSETSSAGHFPDQLRDCNSTSGSSNEEDTHKLRGDYHAGMSGLDKVGMWQHQESRQTFAGGKESSFFLPSDTTKPCRKLTEHSNSSNSSSNCSRNSDRNSPNAKSGLFMRRTTKSGSGSNGQLR